jgi:hypothetical protein
MGGPCVIELAASPGVGANDNGQFGSDCALNEPSPLQLAVMGPGVPVTIGVAVGVEVGAGVAVEAEGAEPPPPPHPAKTSAHIIDVAKGLTPGNFILHPQCLVKQKTISAKSISAESSEKLSFAVTTTERLAMERLLACVPDLK